MSYLKCFLKKKYTYLQERSSLFLLPSMIIDAENLIHLTADEIASCFKNTESEDFYAQHLAKINNCINPDSYGGINPGDQRALLYLINHFKPKKVLEIGTHIGHSTFIAALVLKQIKDAKLTTVDIVDVNDQQKKLWLRFNCKTSPIDKLMTINADTFTEFVVMKSIKFLYSCKQKYDFIFLDGSHTAKTVYQEVPLALKRLNNNGVILLHDYFPNNKALWDDRKIIPGPFLAIQRICKENKNIKVLPLGKLPWETKRDSKITSLAMLSKKESPAQL